MNVQSVASIRALGPADVSQLHSLRLEALMRHPEAFGGDFAREAQMTPDAFAREFLPPAPGAMFGGFAAGQLVGMAGLSVPRSANQRHKGRIFAVYVQPLYRSQRTASRLVDALLAHARASRLLTLTISVTAGNAPAERLYTTRGFRPIGTIHRSLMVGRQFFDETMMQLDLDQA
jgi:ribosomal protein S18 acetylase RimI-like enzyme